MKQRLTNHLSTWAVRTRPWRRRAVTKWQRQFGWPAAVALGLLLVGGLLQWQLHPQLLRDQARLQARGMTLAAAPVIDHRTSAPEPLLAQELPSPRQRGRDLEWLVTASQRNGVQLDRADYAIGAATTDGVTRVEATLPLAGTYEEIRHYVAAVLNHLPHSALESLQIERANTQSPQLQATARLTLFYRENTP